MKEWKFGIVGAGLIADFHARAIGDLPNARVAAVYDRHAPVAASLAQKYGALATDSLEAMLEQVDVVTIATPSGAHMEAAVAAAEAEVHVICEKPMEVTLERIDAMIEAHAKAGTLLGGVFQNRFNPAMAPLREAIAQGRFGRITYAGVFVPWWRAEEYYQDSWHGTWELDGGGALMNQSIHMVDMLVDLLGRPESVTGYAATLGHEIEAEDTATAAVQFADGALGTIYGTTASWPGQFKRFELSGTEGTVVYLEDSFATWQFLSEQPEDEQIRERFGKVSGGGGVSDPAAISYENHTKNFAAFLEALEGGGPFEIDGREARKAVELILAVYESSRTGKRIQLEAGR